MVQSDNTTFLQIQVCSPLFSSDFNLVKPPRETNVNERQMDNSLVLTASFSPPAKRSVHSCADGRVLPLASNTM